MATLDAINSKIAKLQKQAATIAEKQTSVGLTKIRELMQKHGLTVADIEAFVGKKRGRKAAATGAKAAAKAPRASVHHVAPKYADPKTGATWTGRGRAPLWIRDVKDRSKVLIEGGATARDTDEKAAPAKTASAKRVAAKKVAKQPAVAKKAGRSAAAPATGVRGRKAAAPAKKASAPRKVAAKKAPAVVEATAMPEVAAA
ncbi:H-NS histone family protein [Paraburkholderia oxyphila]|uniref:H-NS histone family protein n=1 Tax=Paraburkholderia oxyphila TaxID=614212 RepID=UPI0005BCD2B2|nr:H-NS histone family protein [Paraburkholderia oxyphila]